MKTLIPKNILNKARETGYSSINKDDILYKIQRVEDGTFSVIARTSEKIVGVIGGTPGLDHDAIFVNEDFRGKGIGGSLVYDQDGSRWEKTTGMVSKIFTHKILDTTWVLPHRNCRWRKISKNSTQ